MGSEVRRQLADRLGYATDKAPNARRPREAICAGDIRRWAAGVPAGRSFSNSGWSKGGGMRGRGGEGRGERRGEGRMGLARWRRNGV